jgi:hypothetical protein
MFTRTKPKTNDEEHIIKEEEKDVLRGAKPTDGSHRTITDHTKKPNEAADSKPVEE